MHSCHHWSTPYCRKLLLADLQDMSYIIVVDESTDCSTSKYMGLEIRYISITKKKLTTSFLCLKPLECYTGEAMAQGIKQANWTRLAELLVRIEWS